MRTITDKVDAIFSVADNYIRDSTQDPSIVSTQVISTRQATAEGWLNIREEITAATSALLSKIAQKISQRSRML